MQAIHIVSIAVEDENGRLHDFDSATEDSGGLRRVLLRLLLRLLLGCQKAAQKRENYRSKHATPHKRLGMLGTPSEQFEHVWYQLYDSIQGFDRPLGRPR